MSLWGPNKRDLANARPTPQAYKRLAGGWWSGGHLGNQMIIRARKKKVCLACKGYLKSDAFLLI